MNNTTAVNIFLDDLKKRQMVFKNLYGSNPLKKFKIIWEIWYFKFRY